MGAILGMDAQSSDRDTTPFGPDAIWVQNQRSSRKDLHSNQNEVRTGVYYDLPPSRKALLDILVDIGTTAGSEAKRASKSLRRWDAVFLGLGIPSAMISSVAGATGLGSAAGRIPAAALSLLAAAITAIATFLRSDARSSEARRRQAAWGSLAGDARLVSAFEGNRARTAHLRNQISLLQARQDAVREGSYEQAAKLRELGTGRLITPDEYPLYPGDSTGSQTPNSVDSTTPTVSNPSPGKVYRSVQFGGAAPTRHHTDHTGYDEIEPRDDEENFITRLDGETLPTESDADLPLFVQAHDRVHGSNLARLIEREQLIFDERRERLGEDHPDTLRSATVLAIELRALGEFQRARKLDEETLDSAMSLATDLRALGENELASQVEEDLLASDGEAVSPGEPDLERGKESEPTPS
jgi:hypothetical protein